MSLTVTIVYPVSMTFEDNELPVIWNAMTVEQKQSWLLNKCADIVGAGNGDEPVIHECSDPELVD